MSSAREKRFTFRLTESEHTALREAAEAADLTMGAYVRNALDVADERVRVSRVPQVNRDLWTELAPGVANLNQLAHAANRFKAAIRNEGYPLKTVRGVSELMERAIDHVRALRGDIDRLRRDLFGVSPLEITIDYLEDRQRASRFGHLGVEGERIDRIIEELRDLHDLFEGSE